MSEETTQLRATLQLLARERQASPPEPLSGELLVAYHNDQLAEGEKRRVQDHLVACAHSRELLRELSDFPRVSESQPPISDARIADAWSEVRSRVVPEQAGLTMTPESSMPQQPWQWMALAAGLAVLCLSLSLWVADLRQMVTDLSQPQVNALIEDLYSVGDPLRLELSGSPPVLKISRGVTQLVLILHLGDAAISATQTAQIVTVEGREVWRSAALEVGPEGTATLSVPRRFLPAGDFRIVIVSDLDGSRPGLIQYEFGIQYQ